MGNTSTNIDDVDDHEDHDKIFCHWGVGNVERIHIYIYKI